MLVKLINFEGYVLVTCCDPCSQIDKESKACSWDKIYYFRGSELTSSAWLSFNPSSRDPTDPYYLCFQLGS